MLALSRHIALVAPPCGVAAALQLPAACGVRSFAVRRRRRTTQDSRASDVAFAFVVLKPEDINDGDTSVAARLNPFKALRQGPPLYAVTAMDQRNLDTRAVQARLQECNAGQDKLTSGPVTSIPQVTRSTSGTHLGAANDTKLAPGAVVAVNFDGRLGAGWEVVGGMGLVDVSDHVLSRNAHFNQGYGKIVNVNRSSGGPADSVDVLFEGNWSDEYAQSVNLHYPTEGGFYACVHPSRIIAHANFRNVLSMTIVPDLAWELAMVWPAVISLEEDLQFFDSETQERLGRAGRTVRDMVEGTVKIKVCGRDVPMLDPLDVLRKSFWQ